MVAARARAEARLSAAAADVARIHRLAARAPARARSLFRPGIATTEISKVSPGTGAAVARVHRGCRSAGAWRALAVPSFQRALPRARLPRAQVIGEMWRALSEAEKESWKGEVKAAPAN